MFLHKAELASETKFLLTETKITGNNKKTNKAKHIILFVALPLIFSKRNCGKGRE